MKMMERKRIWFLISLILILPGVISLFVWKVNLGIDFKGGSLADYQVEVGEQTTQETSEKGREVIKQVYADEGLGEPVIQSDESSSDIRMLVKSQAVDSDKRANIVRRLSEASPKVSELSFESIDPQVGAEVTRRAIWAIVIASLAIIIYIAISFQGVPKPTTSLQFGILAVVALLHDVLFIMGFYSIMGHFFGWEINSDSVTAALTVMGFSVHDTIVVFDRLRENLKRIPSGTFRDIANISVAQTIARSLNTSITVILVLLAVVLLGGSTIRPFTLTLLVGIAVGTYSSIFVATPLLDWWLTTKKSVRLLKFNRTKSQLTKRTH